MQQKVTAPLIVGAVLVVIIVVALLAKTFMAPPAHNTEPPKYPDFIDPATGKPKAGNKGSGMSTPNMVPSGPGAPPPAASGGSTP